MIEPTQPSLLRSIAEARRRISVLRSSGEKIVLVPTMGDLHAGHLELVRIAARAGHPVVSIFVNPTQFGASEDLDAYPRDLKADLAKLAAMGVHCDVFAPSVEEMYPSDDTTVIEVGGVSEPLCGRHRPGHFRGVTTIVARLFIATTPDYAVFGQKDAQQCLVLDRMVRDLRFPTQLIIGSTVREPDGLAMSSRNRYLDDDARERALSLWHALRAARAALAAGERSVAAIERLMGEAVGGALELDYAQLRSVPSLGHPQQAEGHVLLAIAGRIGQARLIDNLSVLVTADRVAEVALLENPERPITESTAEER